jgi:uncharacterized protein YlzI (FlbEa/FlbD family)
MHKLDVKVSPPHLDSLSAESAVALAVSNWTRAGLAAIYLPYCYCRLLPMETGTGGCTAMIEVTRLNGITMLVNSDLIKIAEASPDTMLTLIHGEKLIVRESCAEILDKVLAYRAKLLAAVALHTKLPGDLHRLVALLSHNPDANAAAVHNGAVKAGPTLAQAEGKTLESLR